MNRLLKAACAMLCTVGLVAFSQTLVPTQQGGTGLNMSSMTGCLKVTGGVVSVSNANCSGGGGGVNPASVAAIGAYDSTTTVGGSAGLSTDTATKQQLNARSLNFVELNSSGQMTIPSFPQHNPIKFMQNVDRAYGPADAINTDYLNLNLISGFDNTRDRTMNFAARKTVLNSWSPGQGGGATDSEIDCKAVGDCIGFTMGNNGRGGVRGADERNRSFRVFAGITQDYAGGLLTLGAATAQGDRIIATTTVGDGHSFNYYEKGFFVDVTKRTAAGNVTNLSLCADNRYGCATTDASLGLGVSSSTTLTAPVDSYVYSGTCPTHTSTGILYPTAGNNIGGGYAFTTDAKGAGTPQINGNYVNAPSGPMVGFCFTVASTAGMATGTPIFVTSDDYDAEFTNVIAVADGTHFTAFAHMSHATGARITFGGGVGYGLGADADIIPAHTNDVPNSPQNTIQRLVYPIVSTDSGNVTELLIFKANAAEVLTRGTSGIAPATPLTMAATISGGAITGLTGNFGTSSTYNNYATALGTQGIRKLAPPSVTVATDCAQPPVIGFTTGFGPTFYTPYVVSGGTGSCTFANFTVAATNPNPFSKYPMAEAWRSEDPNVPNVYDALNVWVPDGTFVAMPLVTPGNWSTGDLIEQSNWWRLRDASAHFEYTSDPLNALSGVVGPTEDHRFINTPGTQSEFRIYNGTPQRQYYGLYPNYGIPTLPLDATKQPPQALEIVGPHSVNFHVDVPPMYGSGYPNGGNVLDIDCLQNDNVNVPMCANNVFPQYNLFLSHLGGSSNNVGMSIDPVTGTLRVNANFLSASAIKVDTLAVPVATFGTVNSAPGKINFARGDGTVAPVVASISVCAPDGTGGYLGVGNCHHNFNIDSPDGELGLGILHVDNQSLLNNVSVGLDYATGIHDPIYTGTPGSTQWFYYIVSTNSSGVRGSASLAQFAQVSNIAATLTSSNFNTITCPTSLQYGYPSGSGYYIYSSTGPSFYAIGACPVGGTLKDDGSGVLAGATVLPPTNYNAKLGAGNLIVGATGSLGFLLHNQDSVQNVGISNPSTNVVSFDGTTKGDGQATIVVAGCTGCGGSGGVSQIIAGTGVTITPSGGTGAVTVNASGATFAPPTGSGFFHITAGAADAAARAVNLASSDITGVLSGANIATLNQNTTGNAATATTATSATNATTAANATAVGGITVTGSPSASQVLTATSPTAANWQTPVASGTVTAVSVATANGVSGTSSGGATPALTIVLGAITPTSVTSSGPISSTGSTQGLSMLGVGTGTIVPPTGGFPANYAGIIAPTTGTPHYLVVLPSVDPTAGQTLSVAAPTSVNGVLQAVSTWVTPAGTGITNIAIALPTTAIAANTCSTVATATMTGLATTSAFSTAFATNPNAVTGWGASGGLTFTAFPTANTLNWSVCNQTAASITPGAMTLNVGAR